jgi:hypothetical protein
MHQPLDDDESPHQKDCEEDGEEIEIFLNVDFNFGPQEKDKSSHQKKSEAPTANGGDSKTEDIEPKNASSDGKDFVGNGSKT